MKEREGPRLLDQGHWPHSFLGITQSQRLGWRVDLYGSQILGVERIPKLAASEERFMALGAEPSHVEGQRH